MIGLTDSGDFDQDKDPKKRKRIGFEGMGKAIGAKWRELCEDEREKYKELAKEDMQRYRKDVQTYEARMAKRSRLEREEAARNKLELEFEKGSGLSPHLPLLRRQVFGGLPPTHEDLLGRFSGRGGNISISSSAASPPAIVIGGSNQWSDKVAYTQLDQFVMHSPYMPGVLLPNGAILQQPSPGATAISAAGHYFVPLNSNTNLPVGAEFLQDVNILQNRMVPMRTANPMTDPYLAVLHANGQGTHLPPNAVLDNGALVAVPLASLDHSQAGMNNFIRSTNPGPRHLAAYLAPIHPGQEVSTRFMVDSAGTTFYHQPNILGSFPPPSGTTGEALGDSGLGRHSHRSEQQQRGN